jgi:hypothetical protein
MLLASCSERPNDLRDSRYYHDAEAPTPTAQPGPGQTRRAMPAAAPTTQRKPATLDRVALSATDLAEEGVQRTGTAEQTILAKLPDCNVPLSDAEAGYQTVWAYPTGATLRQYVAEYDHASDVVESLPGRLNCVKYRSEGVEVKVSAPVTAADGQVSWCATSAKQSACTVLKAHGSLLSVVVVTAVSENKAKQAVTRIAPLAATALARNS